MDGLLFWIIIGLLAGFLGTLATATIGAIPLIWIVSRLKKKRRPPPIRRAQTRRAGPGAVRPAGR